MMMRPNQYRLTTLGLDWTINGLLQGTLRERERELERELEFIL
jgi:hypothetical protein